MLLRRVVRILNDHDIQYNFSNMLQDEAVRQGIKEYSDWPNYESTVNWLPGWML